ncbi:TPA: hypothetical protein ACH3X3_011053 [Trebouxia sp. C0006]
MSEIEGDRVSELRAHCFNEEHGHNNQPLPGLDAMQGRDLERLRTKVVKHGELAVLDWKEKHQYNALAKLPLNGHSAQTIWDHITQRPQDIGLFRIWLGLGPIAASLAVHASEIVREIELTNRGPYRFLKQCEHISLWQVWMACHSMSQLITAADNHRLRWDIMLRWFEGRDVPVPSATTMEGMSGKHLAYDMMQDIGSSPASSLHPQQGQTSQKAKSKVTLHETPCLLSRAMFGMGPQFCAHQSPSLFTAVM